MENRQVYFDQQLGIEAYHFTGLKQQFPNHFHEFYVLGYIEKGQRLLLCQQQQYLIRPGDLLLFNPGDSHACQQVADEALHYKSLHIEKDMMKELTAGLLSNEGLPQFQQNVVPAFANIQQLQELHQLISTGAASLAKEESFYLLLAELLQRFAKAAPPAAAEITSLTAATTYLQQNFADNISLQKLSQLTGLDRYSLIRQFTKSEGVTPHQYLTALRISAAKQKLEEQLPLIEVAAQTGFADQSHFSRTFKRLIGVSPKQYQLIHQRR